MLFKWGKFESASGQELQWKINCDALTADDLSCICNLCLQIVDDFGSVHSVPRGGDRLSGFLALHETQGPPLLVDDVWTTGGSMRQRAKELDLPSWNGFVVFARGPLDVNVRALFSVTEIENN